MSDALIIKSILFYLDFPLLLASKARRWKLNAQMSFDPPCLIMGIKSDAFRALPHKEENK
jgi:hypothetical protein